jgi:undecaprenyl-diphosphatase
VPAFLLSKVIGKNLESLTVIGSSLLIGGLVMWAIDRSGRPAPVDRLEKMSVGQAVWVGAVQVLSAVFPGTSRSMSTIAGAQLAGLTRAAALEFSFFVSIPTMVAATGYDLLKTVVLKPAEHPLIMDAHRWTVLGVGFVISFIVALAVIAWFMNWVRRRGFGPFAIYRVILGTVVLAAVFSGKLPT